MICCQIMGNALEPCYLFTQHSQFFVAPCFCQRRIGGIVINFLLNLDLDPASALSVLSALLSIGYYSDPEAECQAFHICTADGAGGLAKYSFLCPNGTLFNQNYFICDWWFNFDCAEAEGLYSINEDIAAERAAADGAADAPASYGAPEAAGDSYSAG